MDSMYIEDSGKAGSYDRKKSNGLTGQQQRSKEPAQFAVLPAVLPVKALPPHMSRGGGW